MAEHRIFKARFSDIYPLYVQKALRKGRTQDEVDAVILWLTGYTPGGLARQLAQRTDMASFFGQAPRFNPAGAEIKGVVCGVRVEDIEDPLMQKIRYLDKLIDELAKGRPMEKILRGTKAHQNLLPDISVLRIRMYRPVSLFLRRFRYVRRK